MSEKSKILITGPTSPIGGVTIHVNRLVQSLSLNEIPFSFKKLTVKNVPLLLLKIPFFQVFHLHTSRLSFMFIIALYCKFFRTRSILTYHGEVGIHSGINRWFEKYAIKLIDIPILLNSKSLDFAKDINKKAIQISSFIPPVLPETPLDDVITEKINTLKKDHTFLFCTNAFKRYTMPDGRDVYGIGDLIKIFKDLPQYALIISDPSGQNAIFHNHKSLPPNIYFINYPHSFIEVLKQCNCMIRATLTDGDSISIKEALYLNKGVICSDVVSRPSSCILYKTDDIQDLEKILKSYTVNPKANDSEKLNGFKEIIKLYK